MSHMCQEVAEKREAMSMLSVLIGEHLNDYSRIIFGKKKELASQVEVSLRQIIISWDDSGGPGRE